MPFFSQLSHGGMARMTGFGGTPRNLVKEVFVNWSGTIWTEANMPSSEYYSNNVFTITGDSGGMGDLRFRIGGNNGHVTANMIVTVGDSYTFQRQGQGNSSYTSSAHSSFKIVAHFVAEHHCEFEGGYENAVEEGSGLQQDPRSDIRCYALVAEYIFD